MKFNTIIIIGPQGCGKGTQARLLTEKTGFYHLEMGAVLRAEAEKNTVWGKRIARSVNHGLLLGDEVLLGFLYEYLPQLPFTKGLILDGIPRRLKQAHFLITYLKKHGFEKIVTLFINIPHEESVARLLKRSQIENRKDDTPVAIERRLQLFEKDTVPVLHYLQSCTSYFEINGLPAVDVVEKQIEKVLKI